MEKLLFPKLGGSDFLFCLVNKADLIKFGPALARDKKKYFLFPPPKKFVVDLLHVITPTTPLPSKGWQIDHGILFNNWNILAVRS
ncbi:uncharacterized protein J3R85_010565 [Psidium guajava]|nr:uncharacterized protein J3R85_010565 [Psidium guajava]